MRTLSLLTAGLLAAGMTGRAASPVGHFRLATVDGVRVPMVWRQDDAGPEGRVTLHWVSGAADIRRDGGFTLRVVMVRSGRGLSETPESTTLTGTWRILQGFRVELRFTDGRLVYWGPVEGFARLTIQTRYPDLEWRPAPATLVLVRE